MRLDADERHAVHESEDSFTKRRGPSPGTVPRTKPAFWQLFIDDTCRVWVGTHSPTRRTGTAAPAEEAPDDSNQKPPPLEWEESRSFEVFSPQGDFRFAATLPTVASDLLAARGDQVRVLELGEFGEAYVVRYRLVGD